MRDCFASDTGHARCENGDDVPVQGNHPTGAACDIQVTSEGTTTSITRKRRFEELT